MSAAAEQTYIAQRNNITIKCEELLAKIKLRTNKITKEERSDTTILQKCRKLITDHGNKTDVLLAYNKHTATDRFTVDVTTCEGWRLSLDHYFYYST